MCVYTYLYVYIYFNLIFFSKHEDRKLYVRVVHGENPELLAAAVMTIDKDRP